MDHWFDDPARSVPQRSPRRTFLATGGRALAGAALAAAWRAPAARAATKVAVGYIKAGVTCEGSAFAAEAQRFFRDEGLDLTMVPLSSPPEMAVEMMKGNVDAMQDPAWALVQPLLPTGMAVGDMVATAGLQRGSASIAVLADSSIRSVAGLRGLKVSAGDRWRFIFAEPVRAAGLDPQKDVEWQPALPPAQIGAALRNHQVAAALIHQPFAAVLESSGQGRILIAQNTPPLQNDYCCCVILTGTLIRADRPKAAAITRALMRGSAWIRAHPRAASELEVAIRQVTVSLADNRRAMAALDFAPAVQAARRNTLAILRRFKRLGLLDRATEEATLLDRIFVPVTAEP